MVTAQLYRAWLSMALLDIPRSTQGEGPTAWAFTSGGVTSTLPAIGGSPGPKRSQAAPSSGATTTGNAARGASGTSGRAGSSSGNLGGGGARAAQDWLMLGLGPGGSAGAGPTRHTGAAAQPDFMCCVEGQIEDNSTPTRPTGCVCIARSTMYPPVFLLGLDFRSTRASLLVRLCAAATAAAAELQAAATDYRRWYAENEAAAARRQAALHSRMGQVAAEARDTVAVLGRVTEANNRTAAALEQQLRPVAEGVEALAARLEAAAAELRGCRQALREHRHRQQEGAKEREQLQEPARQESELRTGVEGQR